MNVEKFIYKEKKIYENKKFKEFCENGYKIDSNLSLEAVKFVYNQEMNSGEVLNSNNNDFLNSCYEIEDKYLDDYYIRDRKNETSRNIKKSKL